MKVTGKCTSLFGVLVALAALASSASASDAGGTALSVTGAVAANVCRSDGSGADVMIAGILTSSASASPVTVTLSVDGGQANQIDTIPSTSWVQGAGPIKTVSYSYTVFLVNGDHTLDFCFEQPGTNGRPSKKICLTQVTVNVYCTANGGCTYTQGYWKTHGPVPTGNNTDVWPVDGLSLGNPYYNQSLLQSILDTEPKNGNGLISLAHQLIAAKLNIANGADGSAVAATISAADYLIWDLVVPPVGDGFLPTSATSSLTDALDKYNQGLTGPGH